MGPRDIIKYISYRIVETANDRSGQIIIASPIALAVLILGLFDMRGNVSAIYNKIRLYYGFESRR